MTRRYIFIFLNETLAHWHRTFSNSLENGTIICRFTRQIFSLLIFTLLCSFTMWLCVSFWLLKEVLRWKQTTFRTKIYGVLPMGKFVYRGNRFCRMCRMENQEKWTKFVMKIPRCYGQMMNSLFPLVGIFISHSLHCNNPPHLPKTWPKSISVTVHAMKWNSSEAQLSKSHQTHSSFKLRPIAWNINVRKTNKNEAKKSYVCLSLIVERRQKNTSPKLFACRFCHIHIYRWDLTEG